MHFVAPTHYRDATDLEEDIMEFWISIIVIFGSIAAVAALFFWYISTPKGRGWFGEVLTTWALGKDKEGMWRVMSGLIIEGKDGRTTEIDQIVVNTNGVFVIETKNYAGKVYGDDTCSEWTQVLADGKLTHKHYNPVKQNGTHVYMLKNALELPIHILDCVVMVRGNVKNISSDRVFSLFGVRKFLRTKRYPGLSEADVEMIFKKLEHIKKTTKITPEQHRENVRRHIASVEAGICPRCQAKLIEVDGEGGRFMTCSSPECQFKMPKK